MKRHGPDAHRARTAWLLLAPAIVLLLVTAGYPLARTFQLSFTDADLLQYPMTPGWVGFENYRELLRDPEWGRAVRNTVVFATASVTLETILGLGIALLVNAEFRGKGAMRAAMLVPWAIPTVVAAQMWAWMLHDVYGVVNDILLRLHLIDRPIAWLSSNALALPAVIAVDVWKTTPFMALLLLAGLQAIPRELYEAASVDGATRWQQFTRITLPLLRPALLVGLIFRTLDALRVFDVIYVMTGTRPSTMSMSVFVRETMIPNSALGYGSAASVGIFLIIGIFTAAYLVALRVKSE